jgi:DUF438 domain-containing protein
MNNRGQSQRKKTKGVIAAAVIMWFAPDYIRSWTRSLWNIKAGAKKRG